MARVRRGWIGAGVSGQMNQKNRRKDVRVQEVSLCFGRTIIEVDTSFVYFNKALV